VTLRTLWLRADTNTSLTLHVGPGLFSPVLHVVLRFYMLATYTFGQLPAQELIFGLPLGLSFSILHGSWLISIITNCPMTRCCLSLSPPPALQPYEMKILRMCLWAFSSEPETLRQTIWLAWRQGSWLPYWRMTHFVFKVSCFVLSPPLLVKPTESLCLDFGYMCCILLCTPRFQRPFCART